MKKQKKDKKKKKQKTNCGAVGFKHKCQKRKESLTEHNIPNESGIEDANVRAGIITAVPLKVSGLVHNENAKVNYIKHPYIKMNALPEIDDLKWPGIQTLIGHV
ncbi:hypothetical protein ACJX0J_037932, partial [Zea mays]